MPHPSLPADLTVSRVMGIETEYGITTPTAPAVQPSVSSGWVVRGWRPELPVVPWDYGGESPLVDSWGFLLDRELADPDLLTDDPSVVNRVLPNGARLYVDHAHPEYSSPEVRTPRDGVRWDRAGEAIVREAIASHARSAEVAEGAQAAVKLWKNNTDGKGAAYGTHENYVLDRALPFAHVVAGLLPFFASRPVVCGAGRSGIGRRSERPEFQISARADFFEQQMSLETTVRRGIINTRDEPHATPEQYRRLHVIVGDATHSDVATLLQLGTTSLVLGLLERRCLDFSLTLSDPVAALHTISHDPTLRSTVELKDGRRMTGLDLQWRFYEQCRHRAQLEGTAAEEHTAEVLGHWERVLTGLACAAQGPETITSVAADVDWVAKWRLLRSYAARAGLDPEDPRIFGDPRLRAMDIQWADVEPSGLANKLRRAGLLTTLVGEPEIAAAMTEPPADTRAWLRGTLVDRWPDQVAGANWDALVVRTPAGPQRTQRVPLLEPSGGTAADLGEQVAASTSIPDLLQRLGI